MERFKTLIGETMAKRICLLSLLVIVVYWGVGRAQGKIMDLIANRVIQRYQQASCDQLSRMKAEPKSDEEQKFIQTLRNNSELRQAFLGKVAPPIADKMFECGLIP